MTTTSNPGSPSGTASGGATTPSVSSSASSSPSIQRVRHLVVDSGAIIKEVPLHSLADHLWTVPDVIEEIKDRRARHVLQSLPKKLELREPSPESIQFIVDFSRKTGDFRSISDADIKVLALCYELEKRNNGTAHLNQMPYRELHTADDGKPLFVAHRRYRRRPSPTDTVLGTMAAIQEFLEKLYKPKKKNSIGMANKFHNSAVRAMVKHYNAQETISILEQYRREISTQGREKGVQSYRLGQWFSGQLKQLSTQLKNEKEAWTKKQQTKKSEGAGAAEAPKKPLTGAAAMRALAKEKRAQTGRAWGATSPAKQEGAAVDSGGFPKLVVTAATHRQIRVGSRVNISPGAAGRSPSADAPPFVSGTVASEPSDAGIVAIHLDWNLADGRPATMHTPCATLVPIQPEQRRVRFSDEANSASPVDGSSRPGASDAPADTGAAAAPHDSATSEAAPTEQPRAEVKSRILSAGAGLSSTVAIEDIEDDGSSWVTPENIGAHIGHGGFTKAFHTVDVVPAVGCITTDFAMQNVMLQVGLNLVSAGGVRIDRVRQWVLYCGACFHEMRDMERLFCAKCGSSGVSKLAVSLTRQGKLKRHFSSNRKVKLQGERYSIPKPKGGRNLDLLLREDQLLAGGWRQQANKKGLSHSFMGEHVLGSLGMRVGAGSNVVVGMGRSNPNARRGRERRGKKKKTKAIYGGKHGVR